MDSVEELYHIFPEIKENICVEKKVGQGTFSFVYEGYFLREPDERVALKYIIPTSAPSRTKQEIECLLNIGGEDNVISVLAVLRNKSHIIIIMPYVAHTSFHDSFLSWNVAEVRDYVKNLIIALNRVHKYGILHRDIKPSNFLYDWRKKIYALVDFGLAQPYEKSLSADDVFNSEKLSTSKSKLQNENCNPHRKLSIAISKSNKSKNSSHQRAKLNDLSMDTTASAKTPTKQQQQQQQQQQEKNPTALTKNEITKTTLTSSVSYEHNLKNVNNNSPSKQTVPTPTKTTAGVGGIGTPKSTALNMQKYYSFQKPSSLSSSSSSSDSNNNKCNCFNMQFVCETCTTRALKWAPRAGTAGFRPPEVLFRSNDQTPAIDIWSVGIIFLSILTGRYPFFKALDDNMAMMQLISLFGFESVRKTASKYGESLICSNDKKQMDLKKLCQLMRKNVIKDVTTPPKKEQPSRSKSSSEKNSENNENEEPEPEESSTPPSPKCFVDEFPDSAYDLLKCLLELDCEKRITAKKALQHSFFTASVPSCKN